MQHAGAKDVIAGSGVLRRRNTARLQWNALVRTYRPTDVHKVRYWLQSKILFELVLTYIPVSECVPKKHAHFSCSDRQRFKTNVERRISLS
jgi:hypothetical protein